MDPASRLRPPPPDGRVRAVALGVLLGLLLAVAFAWAQDMRPQGWEEVEARKKADVAAELLGRRLMAELTAALASGGPAQAVDVCRTTAQAVTEELSRQEGIVVRRTALKVRNPANRPDAFERAWLEQAERELAAGAAAAPAYEVVRSDGHCELRHLRPIVFPGGVCSQCHGRADEIAPEVRPILKKHYPDDQATGFAPGDLRGAISVRVTVREPCAP